MGKTNDWDAYKKEFLEPVIICSIFVGFVWYIITKDSFVTGAFY